jgi:hypothetical protein
MGNIYILVLGELHLRNHKAIKTQIESSLKNNKHNREHTKKNIQHQ